MNKENFYEELEKLGIVLDEKRKKQLQKYCNMIIERNKITNLTAIRDEENIYLKHFYDSLTLIKAIDLDDQTICDLGTGAGFPGIVLKIVFPNIKITLVDSLNKRIEFLKDVVKELGLETIKIVSSRIEDFSRKNKEKYDILVTRAVACTSIILELGVQALKVDGCFILMKADVEEELKKSKNSIKILKLSITEKISFNLPIENSKRTLIKLKKLDHTNNIYPRDFTKIRKNTL